MKLYFGDRLDLAYVLNPKAACTFALNFLFLANRGYPYFETTRIHRSREALYSIEEGSLPQLLPRLGRLLPGRARRSDAPDPAALRQRFARRNFETFTFVRDPLARFLSAFIAIVFIDEEGTQFALRDRLTGREGIDLSPGADRKRSCLRFAEWLERQGSGYRNPHFLPQFDNLAGARGFRIDHVLKLEEPAAIDAFTARFVPAEQFDAFKTLDFNRTKGLAKADFVSDALEAKIRKIYARDYAAYYAGA